MTSVQDLEQDPLWVPHQLDMQKQQILFLRLPYEAYSATRFIADYTSETAEASAVITLDQLTEMQPATGPLHYVFHTAFCRSTLLTRALNIPDASVGISEPGIIASLVNAGDAGRAFLRPCLALLSRAHGNKNTIFVKPTNHANRLLPDLMESAPEAKAIMMSNSLTDFLQSVNRKGLMGRRWARNLYLEMQSYAPLDMGIDARENFLLSDMQIAGLAWLLQRRWFEINIKSFSKRMRSLDSKSFNDEREQSINKIAEFCSVNLSESQIKTTVESDIFTYHAKLGGNFSAKEAQDTAKVKSIVFTEEIQMVSEWINQIMAQADINADMSQPL